MQEVQIVFKNLGEKRNTISYELPLCAQHLTTRWTRWIGENLISWINQLNYTKNDTVHTSISMWAIFLNQHFLFNYILLGTIFRQTGDCCFSPTDCLQIPAQPCPTVIGKPGGHFLMNWHQPKNWHHHYQGTGKMEQGKQPRRWLK